MVLDMIGMCDARGCQNKKGVWEMSKLNFDYREGCQNNSYTGC